MSEIKRLMAETDRRLLIPGDALAAERAAWRTEVDGLRKENRKLRGTLETVYVRLSQVLRLWTQADCHTELESVRDMVRDATEEPR